MSVAGVKVEVVVVVVVVVRYHAVKVSLTGANSLARKYLPLG